MRAHPHSFEVPQSLLGLTARATAVVLLGSFASALGAPLAAPLALLAGAALGLGSEFFDGGFVVRLLWCGLLTVPLTVWLSARQTLRALALPAWAGWPIAALYLAVAALAFRALGLALEHAYGLPWPLPR